MDDERDEYEGFICFTIDEQSKIVCPSNLVHMIFLHCLSKVVYDISWDVIYITLHFVLSLSLICVCLSIIANKHVLRFVPKAYGLTLLLLWHFRVLHKTFFHKNVLCIDFPKKISHRNLSTGVLVSTISTQETQWCKNVGNGSWSGLEIRTPVTPHSWLTTSHA